MDQGSKPRGEAEIPPRESQSTQASFSQSPSSLAPEAKLAKLSGLGIKQGIVEQGTKRKKDSETKARSDSDSDSENGRNESLTATPTTTSLNPSPIKLAAARAVRSAMADQNEWLSTHKSSDSGLQVALHPLPLLEISDFITRGYQRGFKGAIVGALLGQQNGREITIEQSFTCKADKTPPNGIYKLDEPWFLDRLEQMKLVHKSPPLELVGWYSLVPKTGPTSLHVTIHQQIIAQNESAVLLGFHAEDILYPSVGDPLPLTIYESNMEAENGPKDDPASEDKEMKDLEGPPKMRLKFRELPYTTESGEAEMIAMQFIREGGANATADDAENRILEQFDKKIAVDDGKGKRRAVFHQESKSKAPGVSEAAAAKLVNKDKDSNLTKAEAEYMSAMHAKYSAVKMMKSRVDLIVAYLEKLPPDFVAGNLNTPEAVKVAKGSNGKYTTPSNNILRQIQALVTNIELATPAQQTTLEREVLQETNDVNLISLMSDLISSVSDVRDLGKKFAVIELSRNQKSRQPNYDAGTTGNEYRVAPDFL